MIFIFSKNRTTYDYQCATGFGHQTDASDTVGKARVGPRFVRLKVLASIQNPEQRPLGK